MTLFFLISSLISILLGIALVISFAVSKDPLLLVAGLVFGLLAWLLYKDADEWRE